MPTLTLLSKVAVMSLVMENTAEIVPVNDVAAVVTCDATTQFSLNALS